MQSETNNQGRKKCLTFCEDDSQLQIDFGKSKYGGPFTTEQVEDVNCTSLD